MYMYMYILYYMYCCSHVCALSWLILKCLSSYSPQWCGTCIVLAIMPCAALSHIHACACTCIHVHVCIHIYMYMYTCTCVYTYIHVHVHVQDVCIHVQCTCALHMIFHVHVQNVHVRQCCYNIHADALYEPIVHVCLFSRSSAKQVYHRLFNTLYVRVHVCAMFVLDKAALFCL